MLPLASFELFLGSFKGWHELSGMYIPSSSSLEWFFHPAFAPDLLSYCSIRLSIGVLLKSLQRSVSCGVV